MHLQLDSFDRLVAGSNSLMGDPGRGVAAAHALFACLFFRQTLLIWSASKIMPIYRRCLKRIMLLLLLPLCVCVRVCVQDTHMISHRRRGFGGVAIKIRDLYILATKLIVCLITKIEARRVLSCCVYLSPISMELEVYLTHRQCSLSQPAQP